MNKAGLARRADLLMVYQKGRFSFVLQKTVFHGCKANETVQLTYGQLHYSAAMVFEKTAGPTQELTHLESPVGSRS